MLCIMKDSSLIALNTIQTNIGLPTLLQVSGRILQKQLCMTYTV